MKVNVAAEQMVSAEMVRDLYAYDPATGIFTHRKSNNQVRPGSRAGYLENSGYRRLTISGHRHQEQRVAWLLMTGSWPTHRIDHRNTIKDDNRWGNLRQADDFQNAANRRVKSDNFLGIKGVRLHECGKYQARIFVDGRNQHLGLFDTAAEASQAYAAAAKATFGEFARAA